MGQPLNIWDKIQQGVRETERLISQKDYNKAMIQARQTLEAMVRFLGTRACIVESDLAATIDQLYDSRWIDKSTREHYHKIRIIGNKAAHEDNNSAADATLALTLLSQEVYAFSDYKADRRNARTVHIPAESGRPGSRSSSGPRPSRQDNVRASSGRHSKNRRAGNRKKRRGGITLRDVYPLIAILLGIILLVVLIRVFMPDKNEDVQTSDPSVSTETSLPEVPVPETPPETSETVPETSPETSETVPAEGAVYKTTDTLNVRSEPSTSARIVVQLAPGTTVNYVGVHDDFWSIINYEGTDVYVATQYLTKE